MSSIPEDTRQAARQLYSLHQPYMVIGDQAKTRLEKLNWAGMDPFAADPTGYPALLSLVSLFQFNEHLSDHQAATATGQRIDWKYALHLPLSYPGIHSSSLCNFRKQLTSQRAGLSVFQELVEEIEELGLFGNCADHQPEAKEILAINCLRHSLDRAIAILLPAIEVLASEQAEWLKQIALPHWYTRYLATHDGLLQATSRQEIASNIESVAKDMVYLIEAIRSQPDMHMELHSEVRDLLETQNMYRDYSADQSRPQNICARLNIHCETCALRQSMDAPSI